MCLRGSSSLGGYYLNIVKARHYLKVVKRYYYLGIVNYGRKIASDMERSCDTPVTPRSQWSITICFITTYNWRRGPESNRRIEVLQTSALPLGYRALLFNYTPLTNRYSITI